MNVTDKPVTRIEDIKAAAGEQIVELAGWSNDVPFVAKLRRVSILDMIRTEGKIPNQLMGPVFELYQTGSMKKTANKDTRTVADVMLLVAGQALVEPNAQQLQDAGVQLTDLQVTQIYLFATQGVNALRPFRPDAGVLPNGGNGPDVAGAAQRVSGHL